MKTVQIATDGPRGVDTVRARPSGVAGLVITGSRSIYSLTHVASGKAMPASVYNVQASLAKIRAAALRAQDAAPVDWTVPEAELSNPLCVAWYRAFGSALAHS